MADTKKKIRKGQLRYQRRQLVRSTEAESFIHSKEAEEIREEPAKHSIRRGSLMEDSPTIPEKKPDFKADSNREFLDDSSFNKRFAGAGNRSKTKELRKETIKKSGIRLEKPIDKSNSETVNTLKNASNNIPRKESATMKRQRALKTGVTRETLIQGFNIVNDSIDERADDNSASEGFKSSLENSARAYDFVRYRTEKKKVARNKKASEAETKGFVAKSDFIKSESNKTTREQTKKALKKTQLKKAYAKEQKRQAAKRGGEAAKKAVETTAEAIGKTIMFARRHPGLFIILILIAVIIITIIAMATGTVGLMGGAASIQASGSYQSEPKEIDLSEDSFSEKELALQNRIDNIESEFPGYDEYNYNIAPIEHNPFTLISYLSAKFVTFNASDMEAEIQSLFEEMYTLNISSRTETRGEEGAEYEVTILDVTLTAGDLDSICRRRLSAEQLSIYDIYSKTQGGLQRYYKPLDLNWLAYIKSYYGYRKNPTTGANEYHRGIDIAVPEGTEVLAAQDGTVVTASSNAEYGNYIIIRNDEGYESRYAHLSTINVSQGQVVNHGDVIGKTGGTGSSTGSHLHLECLFNGEYYNPLFYFTNGEGSIYGGDLGSFGPGGEPLMEYDDAAVQALMDEAAKYLGYPYVWGGASPQTSFDCSGFVSYVINASGFYPTGRLTAQGLFNKCARVSASDVKPGDLIFFTGTYNAGVPVTHVGIYCGNGTMIHCGDPIKYASINTPYWQQHFYSFGRLQ